MNQTARFLIRLSKTKRLWVAVLAIPLSMVIVFGQYTRSVSATTKLQITPATEDIENSSSRVFLPAIYNPGSIQVQDRPYSSDSIWNTPIGSASRYDPYSSQMVATIGLDDGGQIFSDPSQYSFPVYYADASTPRWSVPCMEYKCMIITPNGRTSTSVLKDVPIPPLALPSQGHDAQMIVIDTVTNAEYDFWHVDRTESGWKVDNGTVYNITFDGMPANYNSRGAGVPYLAGLIRPWEIREGHIQHVLAFGYPQPSGKGCVFPATKTDGDSSLLYAVPEGARLQLDPKLTDADFNQMGLDRTGKIIAKALQEFGMILIDNAGHAKVYAEDLENNPYATVQWSDPDLNLTNQTIAKIPYQHFRVLELPDAYWNPDPNSSMHGDCYR
jgi:hypothetical protein